MRLLFLLFISFVFAGTAQAEKDFDLTYVCKAAIATLNGHELKGEIELVDGNTYSLKYTRDDGKLFVYWCKFEGRNIRWRDTTMSRWNKNIKLSYAKQGDALVITADIFGEKDEKIFYLEQNK